MDAVFRGALIYCVLLLVFRISGRRTLAQVTTFDLVLLLIISETTQQALIGNEFSITGALLLIFTLVSLDISLSFWKFHSKKVDRLFESIPVLIVEHGRPIPKALKQARLEETDILEAARLLQGLERIEQIKYAVLERDGQISIIPQN